MPIGHINKDFIEQGLFGLKVYDIQVDSPSALSNVELWMAEQNKNDPLVYFLGTGQQGTDKDGKTIYTFNENTRAAQKQLEDGTLDRDQDGNLIDYSIPAGKQYNVFVTASLDVIDLGFTMARAEIYIRKVPVQV